MEEFQCIDLDVVEDVSVVRFKDDKLMDPQRIEIMGSELMSVAKDDEKSEKLVVNFENVNFFSSAAINKLIVLNKRMQERGGQIRLSNLRPEVKDLFSYTNLDKLFKIKDSQADAVSSFEQ
ncbi:MAG: STAS domain-containing protein [Planctomycetota bacterium]